MRAPTFDEVAVGDSLPALELPPINRTTLALSAGASGDHNPIHIDIDFARRSGMPDVFAQGMLGLAWLGRLITDWAPQTSLRCFNGRFLGIAHLGHVRMIDSTGYKTALADGEVCIAVGWSGDIQLAQARAGEADRGRVIKYSIPKEGSLTWIDMMAIPKDAPHPAEAHAFINFMQRPEIAAANTNFSHLATCNVAARPMIDAELRRNEAVFPPAESLGRLFGNVTVTPAYDRQVNRAWTRFKTGR